MKKLIYAIALLFVTIGSVQCSQDGSETSSGDSQAGAPGNSNGGGSSDGQGGSMAVFALKGNYLYTVDTNYMHVFQISDPTNPVKVNDVYIGFNIETLYSLDNYLFVGSQNGMFIYDVSNPENPTFMSQAEHFTACDPVVANQTHAFVTLHSNTNCGNNINTLMVYDIQNIQQPELIHQRNLVSPKGLALYENYLVICDDELKIFDITNPAEPTLAKSFNKSYKDVVIYNNILFAFGTSQITQYTWEASDFLTIEQISQLNY